MGMFKDKLMGSLGYQDQAEEEYQYDEQYDDTYEETEYEEEPRQKSRFGGLNFNRTSEEESVDSYQEPSVNAGMRIVLLQPNRFEEAQNIASY